METLLEGTGLSVKGNCLIQELDPLFKSLGELVESDLNSIQLDLSNVESIDTAGIQLLASCRNSALARGKTFKINSMSDPVREAMQITGMKQIFENNKIV
tara:strand:+ start:138 stop:437 length:300 start_codon:yes stop_codon:yes gene_type:complete